MTSLTSLPEDLLYCISLHFEYDKPTLLSLNVLSHAFHHATRSILFKHIDKLSSKQHQLLLRSLRENPDLKRFINSWYLTFQNGKCDENELRTVLAFPHLRKLTFQRRDKPHILPGEGGMPAIKKAMALKRGRNVVRDFECPFLDSSAYDFSNIRTIHLSQDFTATEILRFMLLPSVRAVRASELCVMRPHAVWAQQTSNITTLEFFGEELWRIEPGTVHGILAFCPRLCVLRMHVPMISVGNGGMGVSTGVLEHVCPAAFTAMLEPVKGTLRELSLLNRRHVIPYDGSRMDLSGFAELRDLEITSCCLLPPGPPCEARDELGRVLAPGLERLKLDFPRESGIFYHHEEGHDFLSQDPSRIPLSRYAWISSLLHEKPTSLSKIEMVDPPGSVGFWYWNTAHWSPPYDVARLCETERVTLDVRISYPQPGSEMETWNRRRPVRVDDARYAAWEYKH